MGAASNGRQQEYTLGAVNAKQRWTGMLKMGGGERTYMGEVVTVLLPQKRDRFQCCEFCLPREGRAPAQCVLAPDEAERLMRLINRGANVRPVALCSR